MVGVVCVKDMWALVKYLLLFCFCPEKVLFVSFVTLRRTGDTSQDGARSPLAYDFTTVNFHADDICAFMCLMKTEKARETLHWFMTSCVSVSVFLNVCLCVSKWEGPPVVLSTTLHSPAEGHPVCPSSSRGLCWVSDGDGETGRRHWHWCHPGLRKALLLDPLRSAARCAHCYCPHGSVGTEQSSHVWCHSAKVQNKGMWKWWNQCLFH